MDLRHDAILAHPVVAAWLRKQDEALVALWEGDLDARVPAIVAAARERLAAV